MKLYRILSLKHGGNTLDLLRQSMHFVIPFSQVGSNTKIGLTSPSLLPASFMAIKKDDSFNLVDDRPGSECAFTKLHGQKVVINELT